VPDFLGSFEDSTVPVSLVWILVRLAASLVLGMVVAQIYRRARSEPASSFTTTLVLMTVLIAMVTQVIGDNVARAFSLVGALSIVRFRTVVRDTQDTAYVIFAVAVGMAVGAASVWVALAGVGIVALAAFLLRQSAAVELLPFKLEVRVDIGVDPTTVISQTLDAFVTAQRLVELSTARKGTATDVTYRVSLRREETAQEFITALNRLDGVQSVGLARVDADGRER
jgi:uncharacterized membrane protein YhiD involved in acid resistance